MKGSKCGIVAVMLLLTCCFTVPAESETGKFPTLDQLRQCNVALLAEGFAFASGLNKNNQGKPNGKGFEMVPARWVGSGFIASADGNVITNYHVASKAHRIIAKFDDKSTYEIRHINVYDPADDLAILKMTSARPFPAATLGDSDSVDPMDKVLAVGNPKGMGINITEGGVSQVVRDDYNMVQVIRHTAPIAPGNSGGSLYKENAVVGVNASAIRGTQFNQAIPINKAKRMLADYKDRVVPLNAAFPTQVKTILDKKFKAIDGTTSRVSAATSAKKPGIKKFQFQFDSLKDYLVVLNCPNRDLGIVVVNSKGEPIGFADERRSGAEGVAISSLYGDHVTIFVLNYDAEPAKFGIRIGTILW